MTTAPDRSDWQPIATAPKDGTRLLLCRDWAEAMAVCFWSSDFDYWNAVVGGVEFLEPTHWMPLPDPPTDGAASA